MPKMFFDHNSESPNIENRKSILILIVHFKSGFDIDNLIFGNIPGAKEDI